MTPFVTVTGVAAPLARDDVDTDAVIPVPWMKSIDPDYARALFANWRWVDGDGITERPEFVLNREPFRKACILVAGGNFGCGSSREAAVWALQGFGIRCVVASSFGDIFYENAFKNGLLPVTLAPATVVDLHESLGMGVGGARMTVDLECQVVLGPDGAEHRFELDAARREALLEGLDEIGATLKHDDRIRAFQARDRVARPWIYEPGLGPTSSTEQA